MIRILLITILSMIFIGCQSGSDKSKKDQKAPFKGSFTDNAQGIVSLRTFDHYTRRLDDGYGFYVGPNLVVTNLSWLKGAYKVQSSPLDLEDFSSVQGYLAYDLNLDLVLLKATRRNLNYIKIKESEQSPDSIYSLFRKNSKLYANNGTILSKEVSDTISFGLSDINARIGEPVFADNHRPVGIVQSIDENTQILFSKWIEKLLKDHSKTAQSIYNLRDKTNKVYISHTKVKGFRIITNKGNIEIALSDQTPKYRDNFIKLVSDHFYDSLLVHRVIKDFLIQTGASDTKYAKKDDVVGWKGPGYTLPMNVVPGLFHKRGMIAASKLPADRNKHNRSDGSQFYIVAGRIFTNQELDDLEKEKNIKYTAEQRQVYTTIGGAPYLDGEYTVFGWVTKGMDVVDKLAASKTYAIDRPVDEIRIQTIEILKK
ncbi:peptidylprolyl isomerase [Carboxylicivirga caseinilyticus]|uniref:peptidylprolyl isomerase n=1 Tax=Carboxylicivirga caseinilyticus TaxID=3417572 RepID=UPI003D352E98|nr:peptidylprolyl isomerase [Marinilabiliaceae bacterium A049]